MLSYLTRYFLLNLTFNLISEVHVNYMQNYPNFALHMRQLDECSQDNLKNEHY